jgi:hypothetical protein
MFVFTKHSCSFQVLIVSPKIKWKHDTLCIYHPIDEKSDNPKVLFDVNLSYNTNLA